MSPFSLMSRRPEPTASSCGSAWGAAMLLTLAVLLPVGQAFAQPGQRTVFSIDRAGQFHVPYMPEAPTLDGKINADEWRNAVELRGVAPVNSNYFFDREIAFFVGWNERTLYFAARSDLRRNERIRRLALDPITPAVRDDDNVQFYLDLNGRNTRVGETPAVLRGVVNGGGSGNFTRYYPFLGQVLDAWHPDIDVASNVDDADSRWEVEWAVDRDDLDLPVGQRLSAGDLIQMFLARGLHNPDVVVHLPSATGPLDSQGYPQAQLTRDKPYVKVNKLTGMLDGLLRIDISIINPGPDEANVKGLARVTAEGIRKGVVLVPREVFKRQETWAIPAGGEVRFTIEERIEPILYAFDDTNKEYGVLTLEVREADGPADYLAYRSSLQFLPDPEKPYRTYRGPRNPFSVDVRFNPTTQTLWLAADILSAKLPEDRQPVGMAYWVRQDDVEVFSGTIRRIIRNQFQGEILLPPLIPGKAEVELVLIGREGERLASRVVEFEKRDESTEFAAWWQNSRRGSANKVMWPFQPVQFVRGDNSTGMTGATCVLREYSFDGLGLPRQIISNGRHVLAAPARIVVRVDGVESTVRATTPLKIVSVRQHQISFEGQGSAAGIQFNSAGTFDQDGLVDLRITYQPLAEPIHVDEIRVEWPRDDDLGNHMIAMGAGGPYGSRYIGAIPNGQGVVWDAITGLQGSNSGMTVGSFIPHMWIGNEQRGLMWSADSDYGWVPNNDVPAHDILRSSGRVTLRNFILSTSPDDLDGYRLRSPHTFRFQYNASPFKPLATGWRLNQRAAQGAFGNDRYKTNWNTGEEGWHMLVPPAPPREWPRYFDQYRAQTNRISQRGVYSPMYRLLLYISNQIPLRGHGPISQQTEVHDYFRTDWYANSLERLAPSYRDYATFLAERAVREGGNAAFFFDAAWPHLHRDPVNGSAYRLPDGRTQPATDGTDMRRFFMRFTSLMQDEGYYPAGISAHATNSFPLIALPWLDAIADGELPVSDSIDTYPPDRMIAMGTPHNFGTAINFMPYVNPRWAAMHDAATTGGMGSPFDTAEFRHWGIGRPGVGFVPYWRNFPFVRRIAPGLLASIWVQPNKLVVGVTNYSENEPVGFGRAKALNMTLDLQALGAPGVLRGERARIYPLLRDRRIDERYLGHLPWVQALKPEQLTKTLEARVREPMDLSIDGRTGVVTGAPIQPRDTRFFVIEWDEQPVSDQKLERFFEEDEFPALKAWGFNQPDLRQLVTDSPHAGLDVEQTGVTIFGWKRDNGRVLLKMVNETDEEKTAVINLDLNKLGARVDPGSRLWQQFTQIYDLQDRRTSLFQPMVHADIWDTRDKMLEAMSYRDPGWVLFDAYLGMVTAKLAPGEMRLVSIELE